MVKYKEPPKTENKVKATFLPEYTRVTSSGRMKNVDPITDDPLKKLPYPGPPTHSA